MEEALIECLLKLFGDGVELLELEDAIFYSGAFKLDYVEPETYFLSAHIDEVLDNTLTFSLSWLNNDLADKGLIQSKTFKITVEEVTS